VKVKATAAAKEKAIANARVRATAAEKATAVVKEKAIANARVRATAAGKATVVVRVKANGNAKATVVGKVKANGNAKATVVEKAKDAALYVMVTAGSLPIVVTRWENCARSWRISLPGWSEWKENWANFAA
jgi:hypothetical protein